MVEDILYLSRLSRKAPEGSAKPLDLREVLSLCVSEQRTEAEGKGISFRFSFDETPVRVPIREQDAQRLFSNLISNAIRYAKSEINLTCRAENGGAFISVADDGPGIAEDDLPHILSVSIREKAENTVLVLPLPRPSQRITAAR
jgi:signal transduction histidine kinase